MKALFLIVTIAFLFCTAGCQKQDGFSESIFFYPNNFTPNGDGLNDLWRPSGGLNDDGINVLDGDTYLMKIYDKKDKLLFKTESINDGWDGKLNNVHYPYYYYYYVITYNTLDGVKHRDAGMIELLRVEG